MPVHLLDLVSHRKHISIILRSHLLTSFNVWVDEIPAETGLCKEQSDHQFDEQVAPYEEKSFPPSEKEL